MARVFTLNSKLEQIKRRYKRVSPNRFFYNNKKDLTARYNRILTWFLIHDADRGYNIFPIIFKRGILYNAAQWLQMMRAPTAAMVSKKTGERLKPLMYLFTEKILPAINNKGGYQWKFKALIGYTGAHDIRQNKDTPAHTTWNKPVKKRKSNAHHTNRRRHRNKTR